MRYFPRARTFFLVLLSAFLASRFLCAAGVDAGDKEARIEAILADVKNKKHIERQRFVGLEDELLPRLFALIEDPSLADDNALNVRRRAWQIIFAVRKNRLENVLRVFRAYETLNLGYNLQYGSEMIEALGEFAKDQRAHDILYKIASDPSTGDILRGNCLHNLAELPTAETEKFIISLTKTPITHQSEYLVAHALDSLGNFSSPAAESACLAFVGHADEYLAKGADECLRAQLPRKKISELSERAQTKDPHLKELAIEAIGQSEDPGALRELQRLLSQERDPKIKESLYHAIRTQKAEQHVRAELKRLDATGVVKEVDDFLTQAELLAEEKNPTQKSQEDIFKPLLAIETRHGVDTYQALMLVGQWSLQKPDRRMMARAWALDWLSKNGPGSYNALRGMALDKDLSAETRAGVIAMLPKSRGIDTSDASVWLAKIVSDNEEEEVLRTEADWALQTIGIQGGAQSCRGLRNDDETTVAGQAQRLTSSPDTQALSALEESLAKMRLKRPYPENTIRSLAEAITMNRGSSDIEPSLKQVLLDLRYWDQRFPHQAPEGLLLNVSIPVINGLYLVNSQAAVRDLVRAAVGTDDFKHRDIEISLIPERLGQMTAVLDGLKPSNPDAIWNILACMISQNAKCAEPLKKLADAPDTDISTEAGEAIWLLNVKKSPTWGLAASREQSDRNPFAKFKQARVSPVRDIGWISYCRVSPDGARMLYGVRSPESKVTVLDGAGKEEVLAGAPSYDAHWLNPDTLIEPSRENHFSYTLFDIPTRTAKPVESNEYHYLERGEENIDLTEEQLDAVIDLIAKVFLPYHRGKDGEFWTTLLEGRASPNGKRIAFALDFPGLSKFRTTAFVYDRDSKEIQVLGPWMGGFLWRGNDSLYVLDGVRTTGQSGGMSQVKLCEIDLAAQAQ